VYAYDRRTGASLWKQDKMLNRGLSRPLAVGEKYLVVGDAQGYLHVLKQEDGSIAGRLKTDGEAIVAAPQLIEGNHVLIQTRGGSLYALALE
jgi:outer membrane protein assembly factor BamB